MARTYKGRKYRASTKISSLFRGYRARKKKAKTTTHYSARSQASKANVALSKTKRQTLKQRVSVLEENAKKHFDTVSTPADPTRSIDSLGVTYTGMPLTDTRASWQGFLNIQGRGSDAAGGAATIMPDFSHRFVATNENTREDSVVFVTTARLRALIRSRIPVNLQNYTPAATDDTSVSDMGLAGCCQCKVWLVVLQDKRTSLVDTNGTSTQNPPEAGSSSKGPLQSIFQVDRLGNSSLVAHGFSNGLRSYESTRYKVVFSKAYSLSAQHPDKWIDVSIKINKKLQYQEIALADDNNKAPLNYNLYAYLICDRTQDLTGGDFKKPELVNFTSRVYFKDS